MPRQLESLYGPILACAGFGVWAMFSLMPVMTGAGRIREGWDMAPYWIIGVPVLLVLHALAGALMEDRSWRLPFWTIGGHIIGMMLIHPTGAGLGLLPMAVMFIGIPMYVILLLATLTGRMIARLFGWT